MEPSAFTLLAALSLVLTAPLVPARAQMPAPHGAQRQNPETLLGLTPAQKAKLTVLAQNANHQMLTINANQSLDPAIRTAKMRAVGRNSTAQMMTLLTQAQRVKAKAMMQRDQAMGWQHDRGSIYQYRFEDLSSPKTRHL